MGSMLQHPAGNFCWFELGTNNQDAAKTFYTSLFGWQYHEHEMGEEMGVYTTFTLDGKEVGAAYQLNEQHQPGVPPHWMPYVAVESADATAAKMTELGGEIVAPAFDVYDFGRMAAFKDPTGAVLSIWQPRTHHGADVVGVPGSVCWSELATRDANGAMSFYSGLFGWSLKESTDGMPYTELTNGAQPIGGIIAMDGDQWQGIPAHWSIYFAVASCEQTVAQAKELGGSIHVPPTNIPNVGKFALIGDPQGASFHVIELLPHA
ncbi:MAG TPA: VOC family protein [Blastocatellia bacterium]|nr:VOC family protein [Blastocatellia bacterium]